MEYWKIRDKKAFEEKNNSMKHVDKIVNVPGLGKVNLNPQRPKGKLPVGKRKGGIPGAIPK